MPETIVEFINSFDIPKVLRLLTEAAAAMEKPPAAAIINLDHPVCREFAADRARFDRSRNPEMTAYMDRVQRALDLLGRIRDAGLVLQQFTLENGTACLAELRRIADDPLTREFKAELHELVVAAETGLTEKQQQRNDKEAREREMEEAARANELAVAKQVNERMQAEKEKAKYKAEQRRIEANNRALQHAENVFRDRRQQLRAHTNTFLERRLGPTLESWERLQQLTLRLPESAYDGVARQIAHWTDQLRVLRRGVDELQLQASASKGLDELNGLWGTLRATGRYFTEHREATTQWCGRRLEPRVYNVSDCRANPQLAALAFLDYFNERAKQRPLLRDVWRLVDDDGSVWLHYYGRDGDLPALHKTIAVQLAFHEVNPTVLSIAATIYIPFGVEGDLSDYHRVPDLPGMLTSNTSDVAIGRKLKVQQSGSASNRGEDWTQQSKGFRKEFTTNDSDYEQKEVERRADSRASQGDSSQSRRRVGAAPIEEQTTSQGHEASNSNSRREMEGDRQERTKKESEIIQDETGWKRTVTGLVEVRASVDYDLVSHRIAAAPPDSLLPIWKGQNLNEPAINVLDELDMLFRGCGDSLRSALEGRDRWPQPSELSSHPAQFFECVRKVAMVGREVPVERRRVPQHFQPRPVELDDYIDQEFPAQPRYSNLGQEVRNWLPPS